MLQVKLSIAYGIPAQSAIFAMRVDNKAKGDLKILTGLESNNQPRISVHLRKKANNN